MKPIIDAPSLNIGNEIYISPAENIKYLGVILDQSLK